MIISFAKQDSRVVISTTVDVQCDANHYVSTDISQTQWIMTCGSNEVWLHPTQYTQPVINCLPGETYERIRKVRGAFLGCGEAPPFDDYIAEENTTYIYNNNNVNPVMTRVFSGTVATTPCIEYVLLCCIYSNKHCRNAALLSNISLISQTYECLISHSWTTGESCAPVC